MQTPALKIVRKGSFTATPWKNGGGITHEAFRVPAAGDPFRWRVSVAHIEASGPFSEFAAHERKMVLLQGAGVELRFADGVKQTLREVGQLIQFDGAVAAHCESAGRTLRGLEPHGPEIGSGRCSGRARGQNRGGERSHR